MEANQSSTCQNTFPYDDKIIPILQILRLKEHLIKDREQEFPDIKTKSFQLPLKKGKIEN